MQNLEGNESQKDHKGSSNQERDKLRLLAWQNMTYIILSIRPGSEDSTLQAIVILKVEVWLTSTNRCNILRTLMKDEHEIMLHFMLHNILSVDPVQGKEQNVHVWKMRSNGTTSTSRKRSFAILPSSSCRLQAKSKWQKKITVKDIGGMCLQFPNLPTIMPYIYRLARGFRFQKNDVQES